MPNTDHGLTCPEHGFLHWKDLSSRVDAVNGEWIWSCSQCRKVLRVDPYSPPTDLPDIKARPQLRLITHEGPSAHT